MFYLVVVSSIYFLNSKVGFLKYIFEDIFVFGKIV